MLILLKLPLTDLSMSGSFRCLVLILFHKAGGLSSLLLAIISALQLVTTCPSKLTNRLSKWCYWYANGLQLGWGILKPTPKCHSYRLQLAELLVDLCSEIFVESAQCILPWPPPLAQILRKRMQLHRAWLTWQNRNHVPTSESDQIRTAGWLQQRTATALMLMLGEPSTWSPCS